MNEQVCAYIEYLQQIKQVNKPKMPKFDERAYTENEYVKAINSIENDFKFVDSIAVTERYLKGEWWKSTVAISSMLI